MATLNKRATVYFDPEIHKALKLKTVNSDTSISDIIDKVVRQALLEDAEDKKTFSDRITEPSLSFESFVRDLERNGKILN